MRAFVLALGAAALLTAPAHADPAYTAKTVVDFFVKDKAAADQAKRLGVARKICFDSDPTCGPAAAAVAPKRFDLLVNFDFDSDRLTAAAKDNLAQFAKALQDPRLKGEKFEIDGHTDATGTEAYNIGLSDRRADAVVRYLDEHGVDRSSLIAKGFGFSKPRVPDPFSPVNRRVETHLLD